jgi:hypothetical protein
MKITWSKHLTYPTKEKADWLEITTSDWSTKVAVDEHTFAITSTMASNQHRSGSTRIIKYGRVGDYTFILQPESVDHYVDILNHLQSSQHDAINGTMLSINWPGRNVNLNGFVKSVNWLRKWTDVAPQITMTVTLTNYSGWLSTVEYTQEYPTTITPSQAGDDDVITNPNMVNGGSPYPYGVSNSATSQYTNSYGYSY